MSLPNVFETYILDGIPVTVASVVKKGRGYYVTWTHETGAGRMRFKEWAKVAVPVS